MRSIEELDISPWPWRVAKRSVVTNDEFDLVDYVLDFYREEDAALVSAAPELYEALAAMLHCAEKGAPWPSDTNMAIAMDMARKALAKAAGEEASK